jgi:hypothetical protein
MPSSAAWAGASGKAKAPNKITAEQIKRLSMDFLLSAGRFRLKL